MTADRDGDAFAHGPALKTDLDRLQVEGVEDHFHARPHQGGVDLEGVAVERDGGRLRHRARLGPQEGLVQRLRSGKGRRSGGQQPVDGRLARLAVDAAVIDGLHPGAEPTVQLGQVRGQPGLDLDQELDAHRLEDSFDLPPAFGASGPGMDQTHTEAGARPQELLGDVGAAVVHIDLTGRPA